MRRFVDEEIEEEEDGGLGFCLPRVSVEAERRLRPRWSLHRRSVSMSLANLRRSFHYDRLPPVPIHLTVVKLDASRFGIEVQKGATVSELKQAVQGAFRHMPTKGPDMISWWHVWGNFCLSYGDEKLVKDDEFIKDYGIKDGDELHFVRHRSTSYNLIKTQSRKQDLPIMIKERDKLDSPMYLCQGKCCFLGVWLSSLGGQMVTASGVGE